MSTHTRTGGRVCGGASASMKSRCSMLSTISVIARVRRSSETSSRIAARPALG